MTAQMSMFEVAVTILFNRTKHQLQGVPGMPADALHALRRCHEAAHLLVMHARATEKQWPLIAAKAATALLRFVPAVASGPHTASVVPVDKALYLAGTAWQQVRCALRSCRCQRQ